MITPFGNYEDIFVRMPHKILALSRVNPVATSLYNDVIKIN